MTRDLLPDGTWGTTSCAMAVFQCSFAHVVFGGQDWYLVRRDHSNDAWHPVNDRLSGTASAYGSVNPNPVAATTFNVPFGSAYTELLIASGNMGMWVTITKDELAAKCAQGCAYCPMQLTGSSHLPQPRQYCRHGASEDPWISASDHPHEIVYGEGSWSGDHLGQDGTVDALQDGGSNVWISAPPPAASSWITCYIVG